MLITPVVYIIFNRPRHTRETFSAIRAQQPAKLFIIADGPRPGYPDDAQKCRDVREIVRQIDWPCEVYRNYAEQNMGLKLRVSSGLDWVFNQVDRAIVLEDDCLPHPDFYNFCEVLLERYETDDRVWVITGNNFQNGRKRGKASYYFSKYNHVWGWATWRRAWLQNNLSLTFWPQWKESKEWVHLLPNKVERNYWSNIFDKTYQNEINTWDYPWTASLWYHGGLTATPNVNLVANIGFGPDATHTVATCNQEGQQVYPLKTITHPQEIRQDTKADRYAFDHHFGGMEHRLPNRLLRLPRRVAGKIFRMLK
ncbi:MAG: glycosyltransferase family 2 protein [Candidatus Pacebacteria bacterium]|nr:glycosyltransferase family 2 protein [Candidatus Paceibacterota bacterium]